MSFIGDSTTRRDFVKGTALGTASLMMGTLVPRAIAQDTKHGHLIKNIVYRKDDWKNIGPGNADYIWWPHGAQLENKNVNFSFGYYKRIGDWHVKQTGGHYHPDGDEVLWYVGLDPNNPEYLGAECEFDVGAEYEKHVFRVPTGLCFPRNVRHCPQITLKCDKTYGFIVMSLEADHKTVTMPTRSILDTTEGHKYDHLFKKMVFQRNIAAKTGPGNADSLCWLRSKDVENFNVNFAYGFYSKTGDWGAKPHKHTSDQFFVFAGINDQTPDYLGAEVEVTLEGEKHAISTPSCVIIPAGMQHGPVVTRKAEKPFVFYMVRQDKGDPSEVNPA
jgi:hypothetical protein